MSLATQTQSLRSSLNYEIQELEFGTSGQRGKVVDLTQLEVYINAVAGLEYLQSLDTSEGGIVRGEEFFFARDLRPSSDSFVSELDGRGEIAQAIVAAIRDVGMLPLNLGKIPTPALTCYALARGKGSAMVTGSHIPFDRNGYKFNSSKGELLKQQEAPIIAQVRKVRQKLYDQPWDQSLFNERGLFKTGHQELPEERSEARAAWIERFTTFFKGASLGGKRLLVYQHSAVGRDILVEVLERMSALHVDQFDFVCSVLVEHLAKQTGVSGVIFDHEEQFDRFLVHPPYLRWGNLAFVGQKSLMFFTRLSNAANCAGLLR